MSGPNSTGTALVEKVVRISTLMILALAALYTFGEIYAFSQARFFTVDEYMYGHQTWLVARGAMPYVDFYEHHFPLSSMLHSPLYWIRWDFVTGALLLRKIVFAYLVGLI